MSIAYHDPCNQTDTRRVSVLMILIPSFILNDRLEPCVSRPNDRESIGR